jgi:diacylglycerol O-acyltransferase-1
MATTSIHSAVTSGTDIASALSTALGKTNGALVGTEDISVPHTSTQSEKNKAKSKKKYKHVEALHSMARPSYLSHDSIKSPSFIGFRNLLVLVVIVMNLRLVLENFKKYGILITIKSNVRGSDLKYGLCLYLLVPAHLIAAYIIEVKAMTDARAVMGRRKRHDGGTTTPNDARDQKEFYNTWWWIAAAHATNATLALLISTVVVYCKIQNPGIGTMCELHALVVWLKTCSYAFTNRDLRHAMLHPAYSASLPDLYTFCPYPNNITFSNLCYFWWAPTLVYQPYYPRSPAVRWTFVMKRFGEVFGLSIFIWLATAQYAAPLLQNSTATVAALDVASIIERVMKLSTVSLVIWLAGFFALFQSFLNGLAELMRFGDRNFYEDWWNSPDLATYWNTWNKPVYHFMRRHVYSPLRGRGWSHVMASFWVFTLSGFLHELAIGVPTHNILGVAFFGMLLQLPMIILTGWFSKSKTPSGKVIGNCIFWLSFVIVGQPVAAVTYFYAWQQKYGDVRNLQGL